MRDVFAELKRRKVFRVAVMYSVAAWLVLQVASVVFEPLGMPEGSMRFLIIACAAGLPIAIAVGWVFDWTSQGLVRTDPKFAPTQKRGANYPLVLGSLASVIIIALGYAGYRGYDFWSKVQWAQNVARPILTEHIQQSDFAAAFEVATQIEDALGPTPALEPVWDIVATEVGFTTEPAGATVSYRRYDQPDGPWQILGRTPIEKAKVSRSPTVWLIEKEGYENRTFARISNRSDDYFRWPSHYQLDPKGATPIDTVTVEAQDSAIISMAELNMSATFKLDRFHMDRTEVSNQEYQEFVDAGGYEDEQFWLEAFSYADVDVSFDEAMQRLKDSTGRTGPATWVAGRYPEGKSDHPVSGVSWFEAAAYAKYKDRHLPTIHYWWYAALPDSELVLPIAPIMASHSNLSSEGALSVGSSDAVSAAGAKDMFGNVSEWVWNKRSQGGHYSLGLGWSDPAYNASLSLSASPWSRLATQGFRLATYATGEPDPLLLDVVDISPIDFDAIEPISEDAYELLLPSATRSKSAVRASEERLELPNGVSAIRVEIDYPLSDEKLPFYLILPERAKPPYQALIWAGGMNALSSTDNQSMYDFDMSVTAFLRESGRAIVMPIWTDTFERNTRGLGPQTFGSSKSSELFQNWNKDLRLVIDYLQTREDISSEQIAYTALSMGAFSSPFVVMGEERLKTIVLWSGGFLVSRERSLRDANILAGIAQRISAPTLMINGQHDFIVSVERQKLLFDYLGADEENKRHVIFNAGHLGWPIGEFVRENLDWLDKHLGPVEQ